MNNQQIDHLKSMGQEWQKDGMHRIYFNDLAGLYGLQCERYNTGNISSARLDGEKISNSKATKILSALAGAKVWYDFSDQNFHGKSIEQGDFNVIVTAIKTQVAGGVVEVKGS